MQHAYRAPRRRRPKRDPVLRRDTDAAVAALTVHFLRTEDLVKRRTLSIQDEIGQSQ
jgi:hypothetical protein